MLRRLKAVRLNDVFPPERHWQGFLALFVPILGAKGGGVYTVAASSF
jgi:hypothetical protein